MIKIAKRKLILASLVFILYGMVFIPVPNSMDNAVENSLIFEDDSSINNPISSNGVVLSWWNESYQYRVRVDVENTLAFSRDTPVDLYLTFDADKCHNKSVRIIRYVEGTDTWTPIPTQIWNETRYVVDESHLQSVTITFVENDLDPATSIYYVYYDPGETYDDPSVYSGNLFNSTQISGDYVVVEWDDKNGLNYELSLDDGSGVYQLEDNYGKNYHTQNSSSPGLMTYGENLIGYWDFDDDSPEEITDNIPDGNGTGYISYGNFYYIDGKYGRAIFMDGAGDYVAINSDETLYGGSLSTDGFTVMGWVNPSSNSGERIIASWDRSEYWRFSLDQGNNVYWSTSTTTIDDMYSTGSVPIDTWTHVAATYDYVTGIKKIYINGVLDPSTQQYAATPGVLLGETYGATCYGYIGTGSEASTFGGTVGPNTPWYGGLDEFRIYNSTLDPDEIQLSMNQDVKTTSIYPGSVEEIYDGNVFAVYNLEWNATVFSGSTDKMTVDDTYTFYRSLNAWKIERTYFWNFHMMYPDNQFAAFNTLYNWDPYDGDLNKEDCYYYDNNLHVGHSNVDFTVENYTVLHDNDKSEYGTAVGLFITDKMKGYSGIDFSEVKWRIDIDDINNVINFIPGNETDLDNKADDPPPGYTVTIEFWEYIENEVEFLNTSHGNDHYNNMYNSFITPLNIVYSDEESRFFNLEIHLIDHDDLAVPNVNVSLNNVTIGGFYDKFITETLSNSYGNATFSSLPANNYTVSLNYKPYETHSSLPLGNYTFELNQTTTDYSNIKAPTYTLNLTSIVLQFMANNASNVEKTPIVGARIDFQENTSSVYTVIGSEITDINGNVTLRWSNFSAASTQIDFRCYYNVLDTPKLINITAAPPEYYNISVDFDSISYYEVGVKMQPYETNFTIYDITADHTYGNELEFRGLYNFTANSITYTINESTVNYKIQYQGATLFEDTYIESPGTNGVYDFNVSGYSGYLIADRTYTLRVSIEKLGSTPMVTTLNFLLDNISTTLTSTAISDMDYWGRNLTATVFYNVISNGSGIPGATIDYYILGEPSINGFIYTNGTAGYYTLELNSTIFPEHGDYTIVISAMLDNYEEQTNLYFDLTISQITTEILKEQDEIEIYWLENGTLNIRLNDTQLNEGINDAVVSWTLVGSSTIYGNFLRNASKGDGWYSLNINSTTFNFAGDYFLDITAFRDNYEPRLTSIPLIIREIVTLINGSVTKVEEIDIYRHESILLDFDYTFRIGGESSQTYEGIENASHAIYYWEYRDNPSQNGSGILQYDELTGLYVLDFLTETRAIGVYTITVQLRENNYESRSSFITLNVLPNEFVYEFDKNIDINSQSNLLKYSELQDETILISFTLNEFHNGSTITGATVSWIMGDVTIPFIHLGDGVYELEVKADASAFFQQQMIEGRIEITADHHTDLSITTQITVKMPEIFEGMPTFYFVIILGLVAVVVISLGGYKYVQYARIPMMVKRLRSTKKSIKKGNRFTTIKINRSANEILIEESEDDYSILGLSLKDKLSGKISKGEPGGYEDIDKIEREVD